MPVLVVHTRQLQDARDLIMELGVEVDLVPYEEWERQPKAEDGPRFQGAEVVLVGVRRQYRRAVEGIGCAGLTNLASILGGRGYIENWLRPQVAPPHAVLTPREAFELVANDERRIILADGALDSANSLVVQLHPWVNRAATALRELASDNARAAQGLKKFFDDRKVAFATSGGSAFRYRIVDQNGNETVPLTPKQHKHLKQGDRKNTPEECARIYFSVLSGTVIVARCGPHPPGDFDVTVLVPVGVTES